MTTTADTSSAAPARATRSRLLLTLAGASLLPAVLWLLARATGTELTVTMNGQSPMTIGLPMVIATTLIASLAGWGTLAVLTRISSRPRRNWIVVASIALVLSLLGPATAEADTATRVFLLAMHFAVAAVLIPGLGRVTAGRRA